MTQTPAPSTLPCPVCGSPVSPDEPKCRECGTDYSLSSIGSGESPTLVRLKATEPLDAQVLVDDLVETLSPRFQGLRRLGQGGMGLVYVARDPILKRDVAIKVLAPEFREDSGARERFLREAQAAAAVAHPNVVSIFNVGELKTTRIPYFVMQFVEGNTVEQAYPPGVPTPEPVARRIIAEVAAALAAAHARDLVHRDVKPSNVMLDQSTGRAIVLDFGISASVQQHTNVDERLTATGVYIGTPRYMSPEQAGGEPISDKSDMYSLGCVAYELLTGRPVFEAKSVLALFAAHLRDTPRPLTELRPGIDRELSALVERCLAKDPQQRPTADELSQRLSPGGAVLLEWPPPGIEALHRKLGTVSRFYWIGTVLLLVTTLPLILVGARLPSVVDSAATLVLLIPGALGIAALIEATRRAVQLGRAITTAIRHGYAWLTVAETIGDPDGETGGLITGSRRFAALSATQRSELRRGRLVRATAALLGGLAPIPALALVFLLASVDVYDHTAVLSVLLIPAVCALVATRIAARERRIAPPLRAAGQSMEPLAAARLAPGWYESFERARTGQSLGPGSRRHARTGLLGAAGATAIAVLLFVLLVPLAIVQLYGAVVLQLSFGNLTSIVAERARFAEVARPFALPSDPRISPTDAGRAFHALQPPPRDSGAFRLAPRPPWPEPPWARAGPAPGLFPTARSDSWNGPHPEKILAAVRRGFSGEEMAYLERVAQTPLWRDWDTLGRARSADLLGARLELPFHSNATADQLPIVAIGAIKPMAYASVSRAAYHLARNQRDSAEAALRATVSVGFVLMDNATVLIERLIGFNIVAIGRDALIRFYALTTNPAGLRLKARYDSALVASQVRREASDQRDAGGLPPAFSAPAVRARILAIATRRTAHRSDRFEMLMNLGIAPCTNVRELVFGPDKEIRDAFSLARRELVRYPADSAVIELFAERATRGTRVARANVAERLALGAGWTAGAILRNPRIWGCTQLLLGSVFNAL